MENRDYPKNYFKKRLLPLHPRRIRGRVDSDTFFSSIQSIRGFWCVQIFLCTLSRFIFVKCLKREAHSHSAYLDFIREIGAPNTLLTDNAKTQVGKKWTKTSRQHVTKKIKTAPHNQHQNQSERAIQDVKKLVSTTLRLSKAPLKFWHYCLMFIVDCLNFSSRESLSWNTPE